MPLKTTNNSANPDDLYAAFVHLQEGVDFADIPALYSKALLLLANHIGDVSVIEEAFTIAKSHTLEE
ncbi:DUF2783 domain-containing protein [Suttonella sp. R2A3]|uniref:DUF2783 domain-containing protein n=1 Tax=Suttonella sp. R2A3 TaxID=2908648 RepID=UPI001F2BA101|nr:DUF2783 domain-containing protein [Suttonella sp. R2A3]UJF24228.1 DUF2783 domain-containing protein [Suttonella sp. R2A3]